MCRILEWMGLSEEKKWAGSKETVDSGEVVGGVRGDQKTGPTKKERWAWETVGTGSQGEGSWCQRTWAGS